MRSQERVVGDKERKEERKGKKRKNKHKTAKRGMRWEKTARITHGTRKTRGKMEWLSSASIQERFEDCNKGAGGYISMKKGGILKKISSFKYKWCSQEPFLMAQTGETHLTHIFSQILNYFILIHRMVHHQTHTLLMGSWQQGSSLSQPGIKTGQFYTATHLQAKILRNVACNCQKFRSRMFKSHPLVHCLHTCSTPPHT